MDKLISDRAAVEISHKVKDILRMYHIDDWQSEPYHQQQNFSEIRYATIKRYVNVILDRTGAPPNLWFLCLKYVCYLLNRLATALLQHKTPEYVAFGTVSDVSNLMHYHFYQPVYYKVPHFSFPSDSREQLGYRCSITEDCGDAMTYLIVSATTDQILPRSEIRPANNHLRNLRVDPAKGEES
jgi:hypothetical protein